MTPDNDAPEVQHKEALEPASVARAGEAIDRLLLTHQELFQDAIERNNRLVMELVTTLNKSEPDVRDVLAQTYQRMLIIYFEGQEQILNSANSHFANWAADLGPPVRKEPSPLPEDTPNQAS